MNDRYDGGGQLLDAEHLLSLDWKNSKNDLLWASAVFVFSFMTKLRQLKPVLIQQNEFNGKSKKSLVNHKRITWNIVCVWDVLQLQR